MRPEAPPYPDLIVAEVMFLTRNKVGTPARMNDFKRRLKLAASGL
jgi:hypothetical protein